MAWTFEINSTDYTSNVDIKSVVITTQDNFANSISLNLVTTNSSIKAGMELIVEKDSNVIFGGLIQDPERVVLSPNLILLKIYSEGYKQILGRRTFQVSTTNELAGDIVSGIFSSYLTDEGLTEGNIDDGVTIPSYVKPAVSGLKIFNDLADASGFKWWIDNEKNFYFQDTPTYTDNTATKTLTPDSTDPDYINCINMPTYSEDTSKFRTRQFVVGKKLGNEFIVGSYVDTAAETEMSSRYGSGVYGAVIVNENIDNVTDAETLAQTEVETYVNANAINFKTTDDMDVLELINVDISILGISDETYKVTKVVKTFDSEEREINDVTIELYATDTKQQRTWTDDFNELLKNNSGSGNSDFYDSRFKELVYHNDTNTTAVTTSVEVATVDITLDSTGSICVYGTFVGEASAAMTLTSLVKLDTVTQHTILDYVTGNVDHTVNFSLVLEDLEAGDYTISVDMAASTGTFTLDASEQHLHVISYYDVVSVDIDTGTTQGYAFGGYSTSNLSDNDQYVPDTWTSKTDLPSPARSLHGSTAIASKAYIFGGFGSGVIRDTDEYIVDSYTAKTDIPLPARRNISSCEISSKGYLVGGYSTAAEKDVEEYTPDSWTSKTDFALTVAFATMAELDSKGYLLQGTQSASIVRSTDEYTPDSWTGKTDCPLPARNQHGSANLNSKIYIFAGNSGVRLLDTDQYVVDTWTSKTDCPSPVRNDLATSNIQEKGYLMYGTTGSIRLQDTDEYDESGNSWTNKTNGPSPTRYACKGSDL